jgi:AcrR family transcriptional regulator
MTDRRAPARRRATTRTRTRAEAGTPLWWSTRQLPVRQRRRADGLDRARIARTAIALVDHDGLDRLSMRALASALGTGTATLYRHVPSREVILVEALDLVLGEIGDVAQQMARGGWRAQIEAVVQALRATLLRHPALTPLFASSRALNGPNALAGRERILGILRRAGLDPAKAVAAYLVLIHYAVGFAFSEAGDRARKGDPAPAVLRRLYGTLDPQSFPCTVALAGRLADRDAEREFAFGLRLLLDGLARMLPDGAGPPARTQRANRAGGGPLR